MKVSRRDLDRASEGVIRPEQADALWRALEEQSTGRPRFDLPNVAYYFGALVTISAMGWFMTDAWERFGGWGVFAISLTYAAGFVISGWLAWSRAGLRVPGGLLATLAVCMTPLAVYGFERATGLWLQGDPREYRGFYDWIKGSWFPMEICTIFAGLLALRFFRFPFLAAPIAFSLWFMSMDLTPLFFGGTPSGDEYRWVSLLFGLVLLAGSYLVALLARPDEDYAFWGYLFGVFAFWGGLTAMKGGGEVDWLLYGAINLGLMLVSVLLVRRALMVFGSLGVFAYVGHLAAEIFEDSVLFSFVMSGIGLVIIVLGIAYAKNREHIERAAQSVLPESTRSFLPGGRVSR